MTRAYEFPQDEPVDLSQIVESWDREAIVATPTSGGSPVFIQPDHWLTEDRDGAWSDVIRSVLERTAREDPARLSRDRVAEAIAAEVGSRDHGQALVDYFAEEGIVDVEGDEVHLLSTIEPGADVPDQLKLQTLRIWIDVALEKNRSAQEAIQEKKKEAQQALEDHDTESIKEHREEWKDDLKRARSRLQALDQRYEDADRPSGIPDDKDRREAKRAMRTIVLRQQWLEALGSPGSGPLQELLEKLADSQTDLEGQETVLMDARNELVKAETFQDLVEDTQGLSLEETIDVCTSAIRHGTVVSEAYDQGRLTMAGAIERASESVDVTAQGDETFASQEEEPTFDEMTDPETQ